MTPDDATKARMFSAIMEQSAATQRQESAEPKKAPWYVRLRIPMGVTAAAMACAMMITLAVGNPLLGNNGSSRQELLAEIPDSGIVTTISAEHADTTQTSTTTVTSHSTVASTGATHGAVAATSVGQTASGTPAVTEVAAAAAEETVETEAVQQTETVAAISTQPVETETKPVLTEVTEAPSQVETTTVTRYSALPSLYGSMFDFNHVSWAGRSYDTTYAEVSSDLLADYLGSGVAMGDTVSGSYTILLYQMQGVPVEQGIAVQYAGQNGFYLFYRIDG
jgi:hypothetical protein